MEMSMTTELDRYRAPALDKGLDILELLAAVESGLTQAEIAKRLDRSPNELYRMLDRLQRRRDSAGLVVASRPLGGRCQCPVVRTSRSGSRSGTRPR